MMLRTRSEKPVGETLLLDKKSLETSPIELRHALAYVFHLRSYWKPEGRAKLIVPASWMECLAYSSNFKLKCGVPCRGSVERYCPFRDVRFESAAETRLAAPDEVPRNIVSHLLANIELDDCLATFIARAFEGIPHTRLKSDLSAMSHSLQWSVDFALIPEHASSVTENVTSESSRRCLILGMKEPTRIVSVDSRSGRLASVSIPEELTRRGQSHLTLLASSTQSAAVKAISEPFPEWLVLFGLIYSVRHVRIVAYVPHRRKSDGIDCAAYIVDELAFHSSITSATACELVLERLHFLSALTTLRRHVHHLSRSLSAMTSPQDGIRHHSSSLDCLACDRDNSGDSDSLKLCVSLGSSQQCSSEYSTCPSSVHAYGLNGVSDLKCGQDLSSCSSLFSSFCSTCSSMLESASSSSSICSEDSNYIERTTLSLSQGDKKSATCLYKLTETRRREIIIWAQQVTPTEHPVKDNYRMVTSQGLRTLHQVHADRYDQLYTDI